MDGFFLDFEDEVETFKALAAKYLHGSLSADPSSINHPMFVVAGVDLSSFKSGMLGDST